MMAVKKFFKKETSSRRRRPRFWTPSRIFYSILLTIDNLVGGDSPCLINTTLLTLTPSKAGIPDEYE